MRKILLLSLMAFLAASCGDDDDDGGTVAETGTVPEAEETTTTGGDGDAAAPVQLEDPINDEGGSGEVSDGEIEMELDDFYFGPTYTRAESGSTVTVALHNEGDAPHTFTIDSLGIDEEVEAGDTAEVEVTLPASGAVRYYCRFHASSGMQGAFYANEGDPVSATPIGGDGLGY